MNIYKSDCLSAQILYLKVHPDTASVPNSTGERWVGLNRQSCSAELFKTVRDPSGSELRIIPLKEELRNQELINKLEPIPELK